MQALDGFEKDGFPAGEHLEKRNILPLGNPWYWDPTQLACLNQRMDAALKGHPYVKSGIDIAPPVAR